MNATNVTAKQQLMALSPTMIDLGLKQALDCYEKGSVYSVSDLFDATTEQFADDIVLFSDDERAKERALRRLFKGAVSRADDLGIINVYYDDDTFERN